MKKEDLVLLYSGGLESRLLLQIALSSGYSPLCILIDYQQKHIKELDFAIETCHKLNVPFERIGIKLPVKSALTTGQGAPENNLYKGVSEWYVPARNLIFISVAASVAESRDIDTIWFGASYDDRINLFPDCYQEWVVSINEMLAKSLSKKVNLYAPLCGMPKNLIQKIAEKSNIDLKEVWSGYKE